MKGYNLNGTLYIFDATPATIPGSAGDEADVIYVQQELVEEFKTYNPDNSAKIMPYNYKLLAVNKLPWADYVNEDIPESEPETNSITPADLDENTGLFGTITVSLLSPEPLVTEYEEGNDYSPFEAANTLYISYGDLTDTTKYSWTKDGEPIEGVEATGGDREPLVYTYDNNGEDGPMFTVEENEEGSTATITPNETGLFVATAVTEPDPETYTVSVNYGDILLETLPDGLPFEPSMPYSATEGTQLVFTLPFQSGWYDYREGNTDHQSVLQIQVPGPIQDSYEIVWPYEDGEDPDAPVQVDGTLSFTMPAEDVALDIELVQNPDAPRVETELTVVNNLPEGYTCEVAILSEGNEEPAPVEDTTNPISLYENDGVFIKVFNENSEVVNYYPVEGQYSCDYDIIHENNEIMQQYNVYCSIEGDFNDEIPIGNTAYQISSHEIAENDRFGYGEYFAIVPIPLTLTIQKP